MTWRKATSHFTPSLLIAGAVVLLSAASLVCYLTVDGPAFEHLAAQRNTWHTIWWVDAFRTLGKAEVPIWLVALFAVVTRRTKPLAATLLALVLSLAWVVPLKGVTQRQRPYVVLQIRAGTASPQTLRASARASFPSGDTSTAFAVATAVAPYVSGAWWPLLYTGATAIGVLRVTSMNHFPSDVFAGAAIGILAGYVALRLCRSFPRLDLSKLGKGKGRGALAGIVLATPLLITLLSKKSPLLAFLKVYGIPVFVVCAVLFFLGRRHQDDASLPPAAPGADRSL